MADILIRGMAMPEDCQYCPMAHWSKVDTLTGCDAVPGKRYIEETDTEFWQSRTRPLWCPLVPLPEGHGRLGDLDALMNNIGDVPYKGSVRRVLMSAPTIVPAEGGEADGN